MSPPAQSAQRRTRPACGDPEIEQQHAEIDHPNASFGGRFHIFKGIESDILPDGSLDYPENVLRRFDLIIGRIHGQFRRPPDRVINALDKEAFGRWLQGRGRRSMRPSRCSTSQVFVATRLGSLPALGGLCWCGLRRLFRSPGGGLALWLAHLPRIRPPRSAATPPSDFRRLGRLRRRHLLPLQLRLYQFEQRRVATVVELRPVEAAPLFSSISSFPSMRQSRTPASTLWALNLKPGFSTALRTAEPISFIRRGPPPKNEPLIPTSTYGDFHRARAAAWHALFDFNHSSSPP